MSNLLTLYVKTFGNNDYLQLDDSCPPWKVLIRQAGIMYNLCSHDQVGFFRPKQF